MINHRIIRLPSKFNEDQQQLRNAPKSRSAYVYNLVEDLQPPLLPIDQWPSNALPNQQV